ncbi:uncharacterized protein sh2d7 [Centroberyx gerrardi]|uniref:uncharacterized protein sh2d7 n=1 Tax=Centroberyx gerrardi TaxID=166262 RepID=UPI003AABD7BA
MERKPGVDLQTETSDGGLKELVLRWFTETQEPLILHNGNFPDWFQGFTARKDAEDLLRDKTLGCFLIRLSDKAIGYILSYKGQDRCRHFVITQNQAGLFVISGDCQTHRSLPDLIEHYRVSPIQPFGEYLTSCCDDKNAVELYDVVKYEAKQRSGVSVQALRTLWDQKSDQSCEQRSERGNNHRIQQQNELPVVQPPALPPKSKTRKLTESVSVGSMSPSQAVPPVPKRGIPLSHSMSESFSDKTSHPGDTQHAHIDPNRAERLRGDSNPPQMDHRVCSNTGEVSLSFSPADTSHHGDLNHSVAPGPTYSVLTRGENRSKSLPRLDKSMEEEYSNQLGTPAHSPATPKRVTCHTYSLHDPRDSARYSRSELQADMQELLKSNPLYQASAGPGAGSADGEYAELSEGPTPPSRRLPDDTYEQIPGESTTVQGNTYETLEDMKTKKSKSTWGKNNIKWRKFLPEYKKK